MALTPKIKTENLSGSIKVTDITGLYTAENLTGWGTPNKERSAVQSAGIELRYHDGHATLVENHDVTEAVKTSITEDIILIEQPREKDGIYTAFYRIDGQLYQYGSSAYVTDQATKDLSALWAKLAALRDNYQYRHLADEVTFIDVHLRQLETLKNRKEEREFLKILNIVQERIKINQ